jgi:hypothetical protein
MGQRLAEVAGFGHWRRRVDRRGVKSDER